MRGQGVAEAMVHQLVSDAHNESIRILPLCTYVQAQFARHPEWEDVRKDL
ncbi:GNAT family N-acetyltransferase [Paracoccus cavernae]|uniref:GNAT family N-acetyltransferase n=2 Tax=Paracoccus cavernae TaxID=1571207 RepID=A0ABT8D7A4_9RHOB|nr:GNAT family N-acetyltransferase [Paracoccus cavernae]